MKGFKYQIKVTVFLCKHKINGDIEYASVYFNSATKTVILINMSLANHFKKFYTEQTIELMKDLIR